MTDTLDSSSSWLSSSIENGRLTWSDGFECRVGDEGMWCIDELIKGSCIFVFYRVRLILSMAISEPILMDVAGDRWSCMTMLCIKPRNSSWLVSYCILAYSSSRVSGVSCWNMLFKLPECLTDIPCWSDWDTLSSPSSMTSNSELCHRELRIFIDCDESFGRASAAFSLSRESLDLCASAYGEFCSSRSGSVSALVVLCILLIISTRPCDSNPFALRHIFFVNFLTLFWPFLIWSLFDELFLDNIS